ncbi:MAG TPA: alpha/beta fold hydrolase, partial [Bryobacteraceae bacterium]|nr:alpha/beta fold hydrolase [Bryobacteraceae bacterium]
MILRRVLIVLASTAVVAAGLIFGAAAVTTEGALHPPRLAIAKVCPCIAHMTCRDAQVIAPDGAVQRGWYFEPEKPNGRAIVVLHGVGDSRSGVVGLGYIFLRQGYTVLTPDLRGHGESDGISTYGISEEQDIHAWADWLLRQPNVHAIYGFGASLGASVLLESLRRETRFHAIVAESPYTDFAGIAKERVGRVAPAWLTLPFVDSG